MISSKHATFISIGVSVVVGFIVGTIIYTQMKDLLLGLATCIMSGLISENLIFVRFVHRQENEELLEKVSDRMNSIVRHAALFTKNNSFEKAIGLFDEVQGSAVWILAKVISEKLSTAFEGGKDIRLSNIDGPFYSEFAKTLYNECEKSIYLTWPDTPKAWFVDSIKKQDVLENLLSNHALEQQEYPPHIKSLSTCKLIKRRLVIVPDAKWDQFRGEEKPLRKCFEKLSDWAGIELRYIKETDFLTQFPAFSDYTLAKTDFAFFDNSIQLIWNIEKDADGKKLGSLSLKVNPDADLIKAFNFAAYEHIYQTAKEIDNMKNAVVVAK